MSNFDIEKYALCNLHLIQAMMSLQTMHFNIIDLWKNIQRDKDVEKK